MARFSTICMLALMTLLLAAPAMAADAGDSATLFRGPGSLTFQPQVAADGATLTVTGPGDFLSYEEFASAANARFDISADMPDGVYNYELVLHAKVNAATRRQMDRARATDDDFAAEMIAVANEVEPISGSFTLKNGLIVSDELVEQAAAPASTSGDLDVTSGAATFNNVNAAAQVFTTDVIVQGSECVGVDCNSSESFGFDTIRMKENNLRFHFDDTSNSASFPRNDWRFIANDSSNGGGSYLAIEDSTAGRIPFRVEAGAIANALYVSDSGDVGVGTSNPVVEVHSVDGNTPTLRLEQNGSSGFTPQTWDLAGNEANFFVRDVTNGSRLPFKIKPNAPTSSIFIEGGTGDVGLQTESPSAPLHILRTNSTAAIRVEETQFNNALDLLQLVNNGRPRLRMIDTATSEEFTIRLADSQVDFSFASVAGDEMELDSSGNLTITGDLTANGMVYTSDKNAKRDFAEVDGGELLAKLSEIPVTSWSYLRDDPEVRHVGPMAQDFHAAFGLGEANTTISLPDIVGVSLAAVKELNSRLETKTSEMEELKSQNADLMKRLEALEARLAE